MTLTLLPVTGLPEIGAGDDLAALIAGAVALQDGDIVVVTSKVVSKALGLGVLTDDRQALVLEQSTAVVAERATATGVTRIVTASAGPVMTGAGIDASNSEELLLLPPDPDGAASQLRAALEDASGVHLAVVLSDTSGRPWRAGLSDFALGSSGLQRLDDLRGLADTHGRDLAVTVRNLADEIASAADLVKGKVDRVPVAVVRGLAALLTDDPQPSLVRTGPSDWFALGRHEAVRDALGITPGSPDAARIGLPAVGEEPVTTRLQRAVRAATHGQTPIAAQVEAESVELSGDDPLALGRLWARIEVALAGERLSWSAQRLAPDRVRLTVRERSNP